MRKTRKIIALLLVISLMMPFIPFNIFAYTSQTSSVTITFRDNYNTEQGYVEYSVDDGSSWTKVTSNVNNQTITMAGDNFRIRIVANDGYQVDYSGISYREDTDVAGTPIELKTDTTGVAGGLTSSNGYFSSSSATAVVLEMVEFRSNDEGGNPPPSEPVGGSDDIEFDVKFTGDTSMNVWINNKEVMTDESGPVDTFTGTIEEAGYATSEETNELKFVLSYLANPVDEFVINGVSYKDGDSNVEFSGETCIITVPGAEKYTIRGEADSDYVGPKTIIWTNPDFVPEDKETEEWIEEFSLDHGSANIVKVLDENGNEAKTEGGLGDNGFGHISIMPGSKVVFEFVPEYGYQLTDIRINGQKLGLSGLANQFEFTMPNANIHFDAEFTKTEDIVKTNSKKIEGGSILLGENTLDGGSAQLAVNDVELSADKIVGFENAAGDYKISNYLDIDLYQVFYKGKDDSDDVWSNKISELDKEVTITLKLAEGVNAEDIVLVHNIHDGDKYEIIKIDSYDAKTNTITFKTKSFSNYAIAIKENTTTSYVQTNTVSTTTSTITPKTGDNIVVIAILFVISSVGIIATIIVGRKIKLKK